MVVSWTSTQPPIYNKTMLESAQQGLYRPEFEHDACGIGFRANMKGRKSHQMVADAITMLERMDPAVAIQTRVTVPGY